VRRVEDARLAVALGAGWIGCVRAVDSPRRATLREVAEIRRSIDGRAGVVLVGRVGGVRRGEGNAKGDGRDGCEKGERRDEGDVVAALVREAKRVGASAVQIHGASRAALARVRDAGLVAWKVIPLARGATRLPRPLRTARVARSPVLLDVGAGGSGTPFYWRLLGRVAPPRLWIAGGITPVNVRALLVRTPFGIDVSSGVERAPGIKDARRLRALFAAIDASNANNTSNAVDASNDDKETES
jgi:phosphoribosylanthranilate isomerase